MIRDLPPRRRALLLVALAAALALLLAHASVYAFLCDDAFISFRYAKNLSEGHGLVFNPGFERVEGYTNFLWVMILAGLHRLFGLLPEDAANPILLAATVALFVLVCRESLLARREGEPLWPALVPPFLLAATRSVAVWSTSGLETRLFELLVVAAVLRLLAETRALVDSRRTRFPWSGLLFALATLTRPDGLLLAGCAILTARATAIREWRRAWKTWVLQGTLFALPVAAHVLWRKSYYGEWLPNTYYAKVGGRTWWEMGGTYLATFALEYGAILWLPPLVLAVFRHARRHTLRVPLVYAAVVIPHALYVARIGGDHFEYRPLDLYFPLLFLLIGDGVREARDRIAGGAGPGRRRALRVVAASGLAVLLVLGLVWIPWQSHRQFPDHFIPGFPGMRTGRTLSAGYLDPANDPILRLPGLRAIGRTHRDLLRTTTSRLVGTRAEEHRLFLGTAAATGRALHGYVERGLLPADTHIAISAVGVIPYLSELRTLDRLGLTDPVVARSAPNELRILAHDRHATLEYAARIGVDLWAEDPVHPALPLDDERLPFVLDEALRAEHEVWFADLGDRVLLARFPRGAEATLPRFPNLRFHSLLRDADAIADLRRRIAAKERERLAADPGSVEAKVAAALALAETGDLEGAVEALRRMEPEGDPGVLFNLGTLEARLGRFEEAVAHLRRGLEAVPDLPGGQYNLGLALAKLERWQEARAALSAAVALDPGNPRARYALGAACAVLGDVGCAVTQHQELERTGTEQARRLAEQLGAAISTISAPPDPRLSK